MRRLLISLTAGLFAVTTAQADTVLDIIKRNMRINPTSDLSAFTDQLERYAQLDAEVYFENHKSQSDKQGSLMMGEAHALKHHLLGDDARSYALAFSFALDALISDQ